MSRYTLMFVADESGEARRVQFDAANSAEALRIVRDESPYRAAELWEGDEKLCTIRRAPAGEDNLWQVSA